ncbi:hypothetical protein ABKV19_023274, partial [Rosa sericea]
DVTMKIMTFSQQGSRGICILSANGTISNVTLRQPSTSGGTFNIRADLRYFHCLDHICQLRMKEQRVGQVA